MKGDILLTLLSVVLLAIIFAGCKPREDHYWGQVSEGVKEVYKKDAH